MRVTFGHPIGFLENGKDMYNLIDNQARHVAYVRIVSCLVVEILCYSVQSYHHRYALTKTLGYAISKAGLLFEEKSALSCF